MSLGWTAALLALGLALCGFARWREVRPRPLGEVPLLPPVLLLGAGVLMVVLAGAHLVTLIGGVPLTGRGGLP
ncbi:MAG: hypothetical protein U1E17_18310 [Geminicoccaceae bacterium]